MNKINLTFFTQKIDNFTILVGNLFDWLNLVLVLLITLDVALRYAINFSISAIYELEWYLFSIIFLCGASKTFLFDKHVRVDIIYNNRTEKTKNYIDLFGIIFFAIPMCFFCIYYSYEFFMDSYLIKESSSEMNGLPYVFLIKIFIPISFMLLLLQCLSILFKTIIKIKKI